MVKIAIMVGGPESYLPNIKNSLSDNLIWIGVDRGAMRLLDYGIKPILALGDFDSITSVELEYLKNEVKDVRQFPAEKDATDTELAVRVAFGEFSPEEVTLYGATGGRLDHLLNNLWLVFQPAFYPHLSKINIIDNKNNLSYFNPGTYEIEKEKDKKYLAFVCLTAVKELTLKGMKYELSKADIAYPQSLASNEFINKKCQFSFETGLVAVIQSKD
ncbi:thiamine pyrophosphokinase [Carnobacterium iners]|uniref:Thiamine diphosphokinase n=1 Tax=Carnobacterium iners TaxID=1073423 RepID=A0A1X7NJG4_9LACT|nr:thiamine diphosphokinase [Carnobacterium iners]SEK83964.1 thiamine pyrophosphokinase [Carnobacterium iners]SMH37947.1 thiamine pyrophosphokinase [Carnobacterium iners]